MKLFKVHVHLEGDVDTLEDSKTYATIYIKNTVIIKESLCI